MNLDEFLKISDVLDVEDIQPDIHTGLFFGCGPEVTDLIHHLLFDAKGG